MDELLINASLQERNPSSLPWSIDVKEKKKEDDSVDKNTSPVCKGVSTKIEHNQMKELDETCERKCNDGLRYISVNQCVNLQNVTKSVEEKRVVQSQVGSQDKKEDLTHFGDNRLSRENPTHSASEYSTKIPMLYKANKQRQSQGTSPAAACLSECDANTQNTRRMSLRCSLKVSRKMTQESKLGTSMPFHSERTVLKRKDELSISSISPLKKENEYETKQMKQGQVNANSQGKCALQKNENNPVYTSTANLKNVNHSTVSNSVDACSAFDMNVDNELDDLLELTADAVNYRSNKRVKEDESSFVKEQLRLTKSKNEKFIHDDSTCSTFKSKDCKDKDSPSSKSLATVSNTANCEIHKEDASEQKELDNSTCNKEEGIVAVKCPRDKVVVDVMYQTGDMQKRSVETMREKELGEVYKRDVTQDIRNKMDIMDGIGPDRFDKEDQETRRKKCNTKKTKKDKRQKKKEECVETEPWKTRRIRRNNVTDHKYKESVSRGHDIKDGMSSKRPLVDKTDDEEDIFDISPIKNKETLSDFEDEGINTYGNCMKRASDLRTRDDRKEHKKNAKVDTVYSNLTELTPEQTQKVPPKNTSKISRKEKKDKMKSTIKTKGTIPVDEQVSHKKQKKKKSKRLSKTSVKDSLLPTKGPTEGKKSGYGRPSVKTCDEFPKTSKVILHAPKTENEITHNADDDQNDSHKTRHRLRSTKSYTIIKHGMNAVTRTDVRVKNECDNDKDSRGSESHVIRQHVNPKKAANEGKTLEDWDILKETREQYKELSDNTRENVDDINTTNMAKTKECCGQGNINNFQDMKIVDLMYDSDKDSDIISNIQYQQYLIHRAPSETSSEFEFPRPASNRTFIIDSDNEYIEGSKSLHEETECCNEQGNTEEKKLSRKQRIINFLMCCFRPKIDRS